MSYYSEQVFHISNKLYPSKQKTRQIVAAKQYVDGNYHSAVNLDTLAGKAFVSKFHFIRLFKSYYGVTPHQYLISVRVAKAKQLLLQNKTIAHACMEVGFDSTTSFAGLFKKVTGSSPSTFKNKKAILKR